MIVVSLAKKSCLKIDILLHFLSTLCLLYLWPSTKIRGSSFWKDNCGLIWTRKLYVTIYICIVHIKYYHVLYTDEIRGAILWFFVTNKNKVCDRGAPTSKSTNKDAPEIPGGTPAAAAVSESTKFATRRRAVGREWWGRGGGGAEQPSNEDGPTNCDHRDSRAHRITLISS